MPRPQSGKSQHHLTIQDRLENTTGWLHKHIDHIIKKHNRKATVVKCKQEEMNVNPVPEKQR